MPTLTTPIKVGPVDVMMINPHAGTISMVVKVNPITIDPNTFHYYIGERVQAANKYLVDEGFILETISGRGWLLHVGVVEDKTI